MKPSSALFTNPIPLILARGVFVARLRGLNEPLFRVSVERIAGNLEEIFEIAHLANQHRLGFLAAQAENSVVGIHSLLGLSQTESRR